MWGCGIGVRKLVYRETINDLSQIYGKLVKIINDLKYMLLMLLLIRHPLCYTYIQSSPEQVFSVKDKLSVEIWIFQGITVLGTSCRIIYELWNVNSMRWWCWDIAIDQKEETCSRHDKAEAKTWLNFGVKQQ